MELFIIIVGVIFSVFSTLILSYISMATMVGPWIAPTLILVGHILLRFNRSSSTVASSKTIASLMAIGAGGGIIATGVGFALPTLFFLDPVMFASWLANSWYFFGIIALLCLIAGSLGLYLGRFMAPTLIDEQQLPFPVSKLNQELITTQSHTSQIRMLVSGIASSTLICALRDGFGAIKGIVQKTYYAAPSILGHELGFAVWPTLWAIGYTVGTAITIPLCVGLVCKYLVLYPLAQHANYLPYSLFAPMSADTFTVAFCSGIVLCELLLGISKYIKKAYVALFAANRQSLSARIMMWAVNKAGSVGMRYMQWRLQGSAQTVSKHLLACLGIGIIGLLSFFGFSFISQVLLLVLVCWATYYICQLGGEIGMIPFGRFSTFILIPLLLIFKIDAVQATIACVFFNICAASASDLLFDYKTGDLCGIDRNTMFRYQWIGLVATALSLGIILWLLFTHLELGSEALFAQRSKAKALLIQSLHFDKYIVALGIAFGWLLKKAKVNPTMVFGGIIMPNTVTIGLTLGSLGTLVTKNTYRWQPLCAGVLAAESLWIVVSIIGKVLQ